MPAAQEKPRKKLKVPAKKKASKPKQSKRGEQKVTPVVYRDLIAAATCGAILGFSAPGLDQWYLAWFGLVPFLLLAVSSTGLRQAFVRGLVFGFAYDLVYLNWYLHLHPLDWLGFSTWESMAISAAAWIITSLHQAVITSFVAVLLRAIPMTGGMLPRRVEEKWCAPALLIVPLLWVIVQNKLGNAHDWLGVPWPMLEYTQYKMLPVIQIAGWIGGIGIGFLIVMANCALASLIATLLEQLNFKALSHSTKMSALASVLGVSLCVLGCVAFGYARLAQTAPMSATNVHQEQHVAAGGTGESQVVSIVQGNINIEMQKNGKVHFTLPDLEKHYAKLVGETPPGLCVWTESALPTYLKDEKATLELLAELSKSGKREMIVGSIDRDFDGHPYNSAFGVTLNGKLFENVYHKRYLVPFGEYMPSWVKYLPQWIQRLTSTPAGVGFNSGKFPVVIDFSGHRVAPLICFETISPELVVTSVRDGGNLLVNLSDLAWFHESNCGDQMIAFAVMRAVETGRDFVFTANTGPSAFINRNGAIVSRSASGKALILTGRVNYYSDRTPFVEWFN